MAKRRENNKILTQILVKSHPKRLQLHAGNA